MSKFHSAVSRRDFMKGLGLAGAGLGAAAAAAPVFHDLDEAIASKPGPVHKFPWWVKESDQGEFTWFERHSLLSETEKMNVKEPRSAG